MSHTPRKRRSRIAHFKQPFIVGVASSAVALSCGGRANAPEGGGSGGISAVTGCPETPPSAGSACAVAGQQCGDPCADTLVRCEGGVFVATAASCNPPPPPETCPEEPPSPGDGCSGFLEGDECSYPYCGTSVPMSRCVNGQWEPIGIPSCNPPPPPETACPDGMPEAGSNCDGPSECLYPGCAGPESNSAQCVFNQWVVSYSIGAACNPPPVIAICPEAEPVHGSGCVYDQQCQYGQCTSATCDGATWSVNVLPCGGAADAGAVDGADAGATPG